MKIRLTLLFTFLTFSGFSQYNSPESVEYDFANNRWLIANNSGNSILARSASGVLSTFITGVTGPHGIEIVNDTLYVCSGSSLKAYRVSSAAPVFSINLGASFLNGITHDSTYLYITDFSAFKIYRFNMATHSFSVFVTGLSKSPNGMIYDQPNNRCVFVNWGSAAPIMAFDVTSAAVSTVSTTLLGNCDGITKDGAGNYYISSWSSNKILRYNNTFTTGPITVVSGLTNPADIFYNLLNDTLGVPNSGSLNNTAYYYFGVTSIGEIEKDLFKLSVNPNPVVTHAQISFTLPEKSAVTITLIDTKGSLVKMISAETQAAGIHNQLIDFSEVSAGDYLLKMTINGKTETKKVVKIK